MSRYHEAYTDKQVPGIWFSLLRKMSGGAHVTTEDGLLYTSLVSVKKLRFFAHMVGIVDHYDPLLWTRPPEEKYHLVCFPTPNADDGSEGTIVPLQPDALPYVKIQWQKVLVLAVALGLPKAIQIVQVYYPEPGLSWEQMKAEATGSQTVSARIFPEEPEQPSPQPKPKTITTNAYKRDPAIAAEAKRRAKGICQLCGKPAPFTTKKNEPYLETHHIIWLSEGGEDTVKNTAALCPNCHRRVHILKDPEDQKDLL